MQKGHPETLMTTYKTIHIYFFIFFLLPIHLYGKEKTHQDSIKRFDSLCVEITENQNIDITKTDSLVNELSALAQNLGNDPEFRSRVIYHQVSSSYISEQIPQLETQDIRTVMQHCDSVHHPFEYGLLYFSLSMVKNLSNEYPGALNCGLKALEFMEKANNQEYIAKINYSISNLFKTIGEYNNSITYARKSLNYYEAQQKKKECLSTLLGIYTTTYYLGEKEKAIRLITELLPAIEATNDTYLQLAAYTNLGSCLAQNEQKDLSFTYYRKALELSNSINNEYAKISILQNIGGYYLRINQADSCQKYLKQVKRYYLRHNIPNRLMGTYVGLALSFSQKHQFDSAFHYFTEYDSIRNLLLDNERLSLVNRTEAKYMLANYQNQLKLAQDEYIIKKKQTTIVILSGTGIILVILLTLLIVIKQKKIVFQQKELKEMENRQLNEKLLHEKNLSQLQKQEFTQTIDSRNREISTSLLLLSNKNLVLSKILQMTESCDGQKSDIEKYRKEVEALIKNCLSFDEEWNEFKLHFEQVHPLFFTKLKHLSKDMTENELRLCAYIKIGMRAKEIAQLLSVSPDSVKMSRYRLKKKLDIAGETSIDDFLRNL